MSVTGHGSRQAVATALTALAGTQQAVRPGRHIPVAVTAALAIEGTSQVALRAVAAELHTLLESSYAALATADRRATEAEVEIARLRDRLRELETWLQDGARFDGVEHVQLGRMLAHASAEREERRLPWLASAHMVAALAYAVAVGGLVFVLLAPHL